MMTTIRGFWRNFRGRKETAVVETPALNAAETPTLSVAEVTVPTTQINSLDLTIAPNDPLLAYVQQNPGVLDVAQLVKQQQLAAAERERIEQELKVARLIQQTLLPQSLPALDGWGVSAYYQPARAVGGDFYDFIYFPDGKVNFIRCFASPAWALATRRRMPSGTRRCAIWRPTLAPRARFRKLTRWWISGYNGPKLKISGKTQRYERPFTCPSTC